jgi:hypothetical protein
MLAKHPLIGSLPDEGQFCTNQLPIARDTGLKRLWAIPPEKFYLTEQGSPEIDVIKLKKQWAVRFNDRRKPILLEKSPPNTVRLRWLNSQFPNAYFIGIYRNGYAVAEGIKRKVKHDVELGARQWKNANSILLNDFEKLDRKILISYEALTESPKQVLDQLCQFLGINILEEGFSTPLKIHGKTRSIINLNDTSFRNLSIEEVRVIEKEASEMLTRLDYFGKYHTNEIPK